MRGFLGRKEAPFGSAQGRRCVEKALSREHKVLSHIIASLSTVLCSTGTILRRKSKVQKLELRLWMFRGPSLKLIVRTEFAVRTHQLRLWRGYR
jgi:hypothetical protein